MFIGASRTSKILGSKHLERRAAVQNTVKLGIGAMNHSTIYISSYMAVSVLLSPSLVGQAYAACDPPKDVSSCIRVPKEIFVQASPALPNPPFLITDQQMGNTLVMTHVDPGATTPGPLPGNNNCSPSNVHGCNSVSSVDLMKSPVAKQSTPFLVHFQDGRSLLASPTR
jgi:hypothetical protein